MQAHIYDKNRKKTEKQIDLNDQIWSLKYNSDLVSQVLNVFLSNQRKGTASALTKGMVSGGGRKPWKQKGTGRARSGSIRSPLWRSGGVTFVPNFRNWKRKINDKMRKKAIAIVLSKRLADEKIVFADIVSGEDSKHYRGYQTFREPGVKVLFLTDDRKMSMFLRNFVGISVKNPANVNIYDVVNSPSLVIDTSAVNILEKNLLNEK